MTEATVHVALAALAKAFRRRFDPGLVKLYHAALDGRFEDDQLDRALREILENEERFPTIAVVRRYCMGQGRAASHGFIRGTNIKTDDYIADPNRYAEETCNVDEFWSRKGGEREQHYYELAAKGLPRSAYPTMGHEEYLKTIAKLAEELKHAAAKPEPSAADRPHRKTGKKVPDEKRPVPF